MTNTEYPAARVATGHRAHHVMINIAGPEYTEHGPRVAGYEPDGFGVIIVTVEAPE